MSRAVARAPGAETAPVKAAAAPARPAPEAAAPLRPAFDVRVTDDDPERAAATAALLRRLADALGLDRGLVQVRADAESARIVRPHAARGALVDGVVRLDPLRLDPRASASRYVLAHELTHLAQSRNAAPARAPTVAASEREAHATALALLSAGTAPAPREGLPAGLAAFDAGAGQVITAADQREKAAPTLEEGVEANYAGELAEIRRLLKGWIITDGDVEAILQILEPLAFETAQVLIAQLEPGERKDYIRNVNPPHQRLYRREVLASYAALPDDEIAAFDEDLFEKMPLDPATLSVPEWHAAVRVLRKLPKKALQRLDESANGADIRTLRTKPGPEYDQDKEKRKQADLEDKRKQAREAAGDATDDILAQIRKLLGKLNGETAVEVLDLVAGFDAGADMDPRFARAVPKADPAEKEPAAKDKKAELALPRLALDYAIATLDAEGLVEPLVRAVPREERVGDRREAFLALLRHRRPDRNLSLARDLLSTGFLNWVRDGEAELAYDVLTALPPAEQDRFRRFDDGELFRRLYDELPDSFKKRGDLFRGIEVLRDSKGNWIDAAAAYGTLFESAKTDEAVAQLIAAFERGVSRKTASDLFTRLVAIGKPVKAKSAATAQKMSSDDRLRAVVRHLDARGFIQAMIEALDPQILQDRLYWDDLRAVLSARDPAMNARHARDLLRKCWTDSVNREEALLALQIFRSLPSADREELSHSEHGAMWERLTEKLTRSAMQELGLSYGRTVTDASGENALRRRLADPDIWAEGHERELALLIAMEISAGDFAWVFQQSRDQDAAGKSWLKPLVARFELYDETGGRTSAQSHKVSTAEGEWGLLSALFGTRAYEVDFHTRMVPGTDPFTGEPQDVAQFEGMRATVDLEQFEDVAGGWLAPNVEFKRSDGKRLAIDGDNREQALAQSNVVDVQISAEQGIARITARNLALSRFAYITPSMTVRTGPVTAENLFVEVRFSDKNLREPNQARLKASKVGAEEIVATAGDDVYGARGLDIFDPQMEGSFAIRPMPDSPVLGPLFGFVWNLIKQRAEIGSRGIALGSLAVSWSNLRLEGLQMSSGLSIASVSVEGAALAAGGNRAAYKRALRAALSRRRDAAQAAKDSGGVETLAKQIAAIDLELPALEAQEKELFALIQKMNRAGGVLPADEEQRLGALQKGLGVGAGGGAVADIGAITVEGVDGPVRLSKGTLRNVHGEGESAGLAFQQLTDAASIQHFIEEGPPDREASGIAGTAGAVRFAGELTLDGLVIPTAIPPSASLRARIDKLKSLPIKEEDRKTFEKMRSDMEAALTLVEEYEKLRATSLNADADPAAKRTPAIQHRLNELSEQIGKFLDLRVESLTVSGPSLTFGRDGRPAALGFEAETVTALGISKLGLSIRKAEAKGFGVTLNLDWPDAVLGERTRSLLSATGHAKSLVIEGVRSDSGIAIERLGMENLNGTVSVLSDGLLIHGLSIPRMEVAGADYTSDTNRMWSHGTTVLKTLTANVFIPFRPRDPDAAAVKRGSVLDPDFTTFVIRELGIETIEADRLGYESLSPGADGGTTSKYRVEVQSGQLGDVKLSNFTIWMPKEGDTDFAGDVDIGTFAQAKFTAAYKNTLTSSGTLDRGKDEKGTPGVHVGFARNGPMTVDLRKLQFTGTDVDLPDKAAGRGITITRTDVSGSLAIGDKETSISGLHLDRMELSRVDWKMASGATVKADGKTVLETVDLSATYRTLSETQSEFQIDRFSIEKMTGTHLVYKDPPLTVELANPAGPKADALEMTKIVVTDLVVAMDGDKTTLGPSKDHKKAAIGIATSRFNFVAKYAQSLKATGELRANAIEVGIGPKGEIGARSRDLRLDATLGYDEGGTKGGAKLKAEGIDTGDISYAAGTLSIGANGGAGLHIPSIETSALNFENEKYKLDGSDKRQVTLTDINVAFELNLHRSEAEQKAAGTPFRNLVMRRFEIARVAGSGLHLFLKEYGVHLEFPDERVVSVGPITLKSPTEAGHEGEPFTIAPKRVIEPGAKGKPGKSKVEYGFTGIVELKDFAAARAQAQISSALNARMDLGAEKITLGFLSSGETNVDVDNWKATDIAGYTGNDPKQRVRSKGLKGDKLAYEGKTGVFKATGTKLLDLGFTDPATGENRKIDLGGKQDAAKNDLPAVDLPGITYNLKEKKIEIDPVTFNGLSYQDDDFGGTTITVDRISTADQKKISVDMSAAGGGKTVKIPHLRVEEGNFELLDLAKRVHPATPATPPAATPADPFIGTGAASWINDNLALFQSLTGQVQLDGNLPEFFTDTANWDYGAFHLDLPVTRGEIDLERLRQQAFVPHERPIKWMSFSIDATRPIIRLGTLGSVAAEWDLTGTGELARARLNMMGIDRLLRAHGETPPPAPSTVPTGAFLRRHLQLDTIAINLRSTAATDFTVKIDPVTSMVVAGSGLKGFTLAGELQPLHFGETINTPGRRGQLRPALGSLSLKSFDHTHKLKSGGNALIKSGAVEIGAVDNTTVDFAGWTPHKAKGHLVSADARDIEIKLPAAPPSGPDPAFAPLDLEGKPKEPVK